MRCLIIENGVVVNSVEASAEFAQKQGWIVSADGNIGDLWDGADFSSPPIKIKTPTAVTMRQARLALLSVGLLDDVSVAIAALPSPQKEAATIEWEYSQEVQRHNGFVSVLAPGLGLDSDSLDALFITAKGM